MGMHGADIANDEKMVPTVYVLFNLFYGEPLSMAEAQEIVDYVQEIISTTVGYNNPLFTLNAFAFWDEGEGEAIFGEGVVLPNKLVMGDGYLEALSDIGLGDVAPSNVHAHEFAHHVQRVLGVLEGQSEIPEEDRPEATRRTELMADAFGTYYLAHARGAAYQSKRLIDALRDAYNSGDCYFDDPNHHGTPNQRERAAKWGIDLAAAAKKQGKIKPSALMLELFDAELPNLVAPDAP